MPLTPAGQRMKDDMIKRMGADEGERAFYATANKRGLKGMIEAPMMGGGKPKGMGMDMGKKRVVVKKNKKMMD